MTETDFVYRTHNLKTTSAHFGQLWLGHKTFELRFNDRDFRVGDTLILQEVEDNEYSGRELTAQVTHMMTCPDLEKYVIMSLNITEMREE